jgi:predicted transposase YdaD
MGIREAIETALKEQGKAEGIIEGITKGEAKGEAKGELKADKKNTFGMLSEGLSPEAIARITKQPIEVILEWKKEWENTQA